MIGTPDELLVAALGFCLYTYLGYPTLLKLVGSRRRAPRRTAPPAEWPSISITIPVHNEAEVIAGTLERILELDYPAERRQILVVSDASSDGTDKIVSGLADRGVELLRLPERRGKTAAENAARAHLRGTIIVNTDASVRIALQALKPLVAAFADPTVGVASGRDVSVARVGAEANAGESTYVGYEMGVRDLETRVVVARRRAAARVTRPGGVPVRRQRGCAARLAVGPPACADRSLGAHATQCGPPGLTRRRTPCAEAPSSARPPLLSRASCSSRSTAGRAAVAGGRKRAQRRCARAS